MEEFSLAPVARRLAYRLHKKVVLALIALARRWRS